MTLHLSNVVFAESQQLTHIHFCWFQLVRFPLLAALSTAMLLAATFEVRAQQQVHLEAEDGWAIAAEVYGSGPHGLVLIHGGRLTKESWHKQAEQFRAAGYQVISIDLRGFGQSQSPPNQRASEDSKEMDIVAAVKYLQRHGAQRISLIGASMGGDAAADAAGTLASGTVDCLVLLSSAGGGKPDKVRARKVLIVAARDDQRSNGERRWPNIQSGYEKITTPKSLVLIDGTAHAQGLFDTKDGRKVIDDILHFLSEP